MRILIAALALALTLASCSSGGQTTNPTPQPTPQPAPQPTPPPSPPTPPVGSTACPATISIGPGNTYSPSSCTIKIGEEVTISASSTHPLIGSGAGAVISANTSQKLAFATAGTFSYVCDRHKPGMAGTITVEP